MPTCAAGLHALLRSSPADWFGQHHVTQGREYARTLLRLFSVHQLAQRNTVLTQSAIHRAESKLRNDQEAPRIKSNQSEMKKGKISGARSLLNFS